MFGNQMPGETSGASTEEKEVVLGGFVLEEQFGESPLTTGYYGYGQKDPVSRVAVEVLKPQYSSTYEAELFKMAMEGRGYTTGEDGARFYATKELAEGETPAVLSNNEILEALKDPDLNFDDSEIKNYMREWKLTESSE